MFLNAKSVQQVAALPFVPVTVSAAGKIIESFEVLLITSRKQGHWLLPKGWPKGKTSFAENAAREAHEEAGVTGQVQSDPIGDYTYMKSMRAYYVALSAAITVIIASWLGLPVSSTHIAVGAVFGVGFLRELYTRRSKRRRDMVAGPGNGSRNGDANADGPRLPSDVLRRSKLVRRSHFLTIIAASVITVPAAALLSAAVFYILSAVA